MADKKLSLRLLGMGAARNAGEALAGRDEQLRLQMEQAEGSGTQKKKPKPSQALGVRTD